MEKMGVLRAERQAEMQGIKTGCFMQARDVKAVEMENVRLQARNEELANKIGDLRMLFRKLHEESSEQIGLQREKNKKLEEKVSILENEIKSMTKESDHMSRSALLFK